MYLAVVRCMGMYMHVPLGDAAAMRQLWQPVVDEERHRELLIIGKKVKKKGSLFTSLTR